MTTRAVRRMGRLKSNVAAAALALAVVVGPATAARASTPAARTVVHRFLNELDRAEITMPKIARSVKSLGAGAYYVHANPHAQATGGRAKLDLLLTLHPDEKIFDERRVLYLAPPARVAFRLRVPRSAALEFGVMGRGRSTFSVSLVRAGGATTPLHSERLGGNGLAWRDVRLDLAAYADEEVTLAFETQAPSTYAQAFVSDPIVVGSGAKQPDNVLLLMVDTLRADGLGCLGNPRNVSPNIDRYCRRGTAFKQAFSNSNWTKPSIFSVFTSEYPTRVGLNFDAWFFNPGEREHFYTRRPPLVPLAFSRAGFVTAAFMNNLFVQGFHQFGIDVGFDRSFDNRDGYLDSASLTKEVIPFITANRDRAWFIYMHYNAPHQIYIPPEKYKAQVRLGPNDKTSDILRRYFGEIALTDDFVGRVFKTLEDLGLAERTLVVIVGDHGEAMDEAHVYEVLKTGRISSFTHGVTLYDEELHVPLVFVRPGVVPEGKQIASSVPLLDLAPTLFDLAGLPPDPRHQGRSLVPMMRGDEPEVDRVVFSEGKGNRAIRSGGWKYYARLPGFELLERDGRTVRQPEELFDVRADPSERRNLIDAVEARGERERLRGELKRFREEIAVRHPVVGVGKTGETTETQSRRDLREKKKGAKIEEAGAFARYHVVASGDAGEHRWVGEVRIAGGRVTKIRPIALGNRSGVWNEGERVLVDLVLGKTPSGAVFDVAPADAEVRIVGTLDGKPLGSDRVFLGSYGIATADAEVGSVRVDAARGIDARRAPMIRPGGELGVFVWRAKARRAKSGMGRARPSSVVSGAPSPEPASLPELEGLSLPKADGEGAAGRGVERALRDWGYIQRGEKERAR